ncbi:hypothetical protein E5676_scaffold180G00920 [Cucumis melo var. makuwa]|uniref:Uncharacterized protein n=1 Tax=Cucumis melo var. makuwa TaxID=1194695 RepID=A0A5D3BHR3_CUCMM|nr:hypothetical protein E5676_scaffold180G00920 [Cucumis melo var. makuwa]
MFLKLESWKKSCIFKGALTFEGVLEVGDLEESLYLQRSFNLQRTPEPTPAIVSCSSSLAHRRLPIVVCPSSLALRRLPFVGRCPVHFVAPIRTIQSTSSVLFR